MNVNESAKLKVQQAMLFKKQNHCVTVFKAALQKDSIHFFQIWLLISKFCPTEIVVTLKTFLDEKDDSIAIILENYKNQFNIDGKKKFVRINF